MRGPETRLRRRIMKALGAKYPDAWVRHIHGNQFQMVGIPDIICCLEGTTIAIEVKRPGKKATPAQELEIKKIQKAGGYATTVTSVEETLEFVRKCLLG